MDERLVYVGAGAVLGGLGIYALTKILEKPPEDIEAQAKKVEVLDTLYGVTLKRKFAYKYSVSYALAGVKYIHRGAVYILLRGEDPEAYLDVSFWEDSGAYNAEVGRDTAAPLIVYLEGTEVARFNAVDINEIVYGYIYFEITRISSARAPFQSKTILLYEK